MVYLMRTLQSVQMAANGVATISNATSGDCNIDASYTPNTNFNGTDTFTVTITDDDNNVETQDITVTVNNVNDAATFGWKFKWNRR